MRSRLPRRQKRHRPAAARSRAGACHATGCRRQEEGVTPASPEEQAAHDHFVAKAWQLIY
jgi:hypothetical protein